jgi:hypothetical protein
MISKDKIIVEKRLIIKPSKISHEKRLVEKKKGSYNCSFLLRKKIRIIKFHKFRSRDSLKKGKECITTRRIFTFYE